MFLPSIYEFTDPTAFIRAVFEGAKKGSPGWSVRAWARRLKQKNPAMLAGVLKGERSLTSEWVEKLASDLKLPGSERRYFHLMVKSQRAQAPSERRLFEELLQELRITLQDRVFPLDSFKLISDWYHLTILELANLPGFQADAAWIQSRLRLDVGADLLTQAIERLGRLGLLKVDAKGKTTRFSLDRVLIDPRTRSDAVRKFHTQMLEHAAIAAQDLEVHERFLQGSTVALTAAGYEELCRQISVFQKKACKLGAVEDGAEIYFFGTQLIPLTQGPSI